MLEILFLDETGRVMYAITDVSLVRHITPSEIGFTYVNGRKSSCSFPHTQKLEVAHKSNSPMRDALLRQVPHA